MTDLAEKLESNIITRTKGKLVLKKDCIFCKIISKETPTKTLFENNEVTVFYDIRPAAREHLLIIPNTHLGNPKTLTKKDIPIIEYLHTVGKSVLEQKGGTLDDAIVGFHWPPFNTVQHLHLHVVYPVSEMSFMKRLMYRPDSIFFATYDWVLNRLNNLPDPPPSQQEPPPSQQEPPPQGQKNKDY